MASKDGIYVAEIGTVGAPMVNGVSEDRRIELRGPEGITKMATALKLEPALFTINNAVTLSALRAKWKTTPATDKAQDRRAAEFLDTIFDDMSTEFDKVMRFILSGIAFGFSDTYLVYKRRQGRSPKRNQVESRHDDGFVGLHKLAIRRQETIARWERDLVGDVIGMVQVDPETGKEYPPVNIERFLHFSFGNDRGNWEGQGWLEPAYKPYRMIAELEQIYGIGQQRAHVGLPVFEYESASPPADVQARIETIGRNLMVNHQQFVTYPKPVVTMRLETVNNQGGGELREQIKQMRWELSAMALLTFLRLGNSETGARSLADPLLELFRDSIDSYNKTAAAVFNRHLVPRLMRANPELGQAVTDYPQFTPTSVTEIPLQVLTYLGQISAFLSTAQAPDANWLRNSLGMEPIEYDPDEIKPAVSPPPTDPNAEEDGTDSEGEDQDAADEEKDAEDGAGKKKGKEEEQELSTWARWTTTITPQEAEFMRKAATELQMARASYLANHNHRGRHARR